MDLQYDVIIIGAGPAGMTAAVYAQSCRSENGDVGKSGARRQDDQNL